MQDESSDQKKQNLGREQAKFIRNILDQEYFMEKLDGIESGISDLVKIITDLSLLLTEQKQLTEQLVKLNAQEVIEEYYDEETCEEIYKEFGIVPSDVELISN